MPVLPVGHVPKFDRVVRMKIDAIERFRMEEPITKDERPLRRLRPELMHHDIIRVHAQEHVRKNGIIENPIMTLALDVAYRQRTAVAGHRQTIAFCDPHKSTEKGSFTQIVLR